MNTLDHVSELLSLYLDGQLTAGELSSVEQHLESCKLCQAELQDLRQLQSLLRRLPAHDVPRSFVIGPRSLKPAALSGTAGGFVRAVTSIAASLAVVGLGINLAIMGLPGREPTNAAPAPAQLAASAEPPGNAPSPAGSPAATGKPAASFAAGAAPKAAIAAASRAAAASAAASAAESPSPLARAVAPQGAAAPGGQAEPAQGAATQAKVSAESPDVAVRSAPPPASSADLPTSSVPVSVGSSSTAPAADAGAERVAPLVISQPSPSSQLAARRPNTPLLIGEWMAFAAVVAFAVYSLRWWRR